HRPARPRGRGPAGCHAREPTRRAGPRVPPRLREARGRPACAAAPARRRDDIQSRGLPLPRPQGSRPPGDGGGAHPARGAACGERLCAGVRDTRPRLVADTDYVIGITAVLRPEKNHIQLIEAIARLRRAGLPARGLLIGDGPMRGVVEARARSLGVEREVTVTGFREDVRPYLAACDVVCLCSLTTEALSLAAIEAMAMGKPLVHSQVGGATELIEPGRNGLLFPPGDTGALVECLSQLTDRDTRLAMGRSARAKAEAAFDEEAMIDRYERLLLGVCGSVEQVTARAAAGAAGHDAPETDVPRATALLLGPRLDAVGGISTHLSLLMSSR